MTGDQYKSCELCPNMCGVDRTAGETGICGESSELRIAAEVPHRGEEPPLTARGAVGNIFLTGCSLKCVYCQNYQASQGGVGEAVSPEGLAQRMIELQNAGCSGIGWVTPAHQIPNLLIAHSISARWGLKLPLIYNTNSYERVETLRSLEGVVDVYLADLRYSDDGMAKRYSGADNYVEISRSAAEEMFRQAGSFDEAALRGLVVRVLVLPEDIDGVWKTLCFIALELSRKVPVSLMSQYHPVHRAGEFPEINRFITETEYYEAVKMARSLGFETIYIQELDPRRHLMPDFTRREKPFDG